MCGKYVGQVPVKLIKKSIYSANANEIKIISVISQLIIILLLEEI